MIKTTFPPNYEDVKKVFTHQKGTIYCFGDDIYNPDNSFIDEFQLKHEAVHTKQQGKDPAIWWKRYMVDGDFRFVQELEAFQAQYEAYCQKVKDRNEQTKFLLKLGNALSGQTYLKLCDRNQAMSLIKSKTKFYVSPD